jgi:hypothetical protein
MRSREITASIEVFDLLERRSDGTTTWRGVVDGLDAAQAQVKRLAAETGHQCFAMGREGVIALAGGEQAA